MLVFSPMEMTRLWWSLSTNALVNQIRCTQVFMEAMSKPQQEAVIGMAAPLNACGVGFGTMAMRPTEAPRMNYTSEPRAPSAHTPKSRRRRQPSLPPAMPQSVSIPV